MLLFVLGIIFTIFSAMLALKYSSYKNICQEVIGFFGTLFCIIGSVICIIMVGTFISVSVSAPADVVANQQLYNSLTYQLEHNLYDNDNDIGKKELWNQITDWNTELAKNKQMQHNIWVGMFYPNIYDQFDFIAFPEESS